MNRRVLGVALAATVLDGACSAATSPSAAPSSQAPTTAAPSAAPRSPATASQSLTIHVLEDPIDRAGVKVGSLTGCKDTTCLGDYLVGHSSMVDASTNMTVGALVTECFVVDAGTGRYHCPSSMIELTGRGQIVFTEDPYIGNNTTPSKDWPVIGATGEFLGMTGSVASPANSTAKYGDFVITLTK
jgi:hypothetical protein